MISSIFFIAPLLSLATLEEQRSTGSGAILLNLTNGHACHRRASDGTRPRPHGFLPHHQSSRRRAMNNPFRNQDRDRQQDRGRWTEQGQDGGYYGDGARSQGQDWGRDRSYERNSPYAQGQGGYARDHDQGHGQYGAPSQGASAGQANWGGNYGQSAGDQWNTRSGPGSQSSWHGQMNMGPSGYDQGRSQGMDSGGWSQGGGHGQPSYGQLPSNQSWGQSSYGQGSPSSYGQTSPGRQQSGSHHDFEPDYLHWREQQMANYDRDYHEWRNEKRQKFSSDFEGWRTSRGPAVQAENSVVGDVTDGGGGSQTHAKALHEDKPAKH
jgi:hypothetical protein